ncbi:electron transport complex protein RnfD [Halanaerobium congolense]|jgi:electron transport complex protein RnfD|uniref:Ion-translocating oxidoreductase complex subunit D n=1 Tax=Halanaerobium congolense TaxID=54121 RepID=A0A318DZ08_9FIRM|nr:RnfABCDGE type electron transport complex subunit D [Halanaerobium congolense]PXV63248.1 electron transport complex protein RnfD [Halanaerobium congolense]
MNNELIVTSSPHIRAQDSVPKIMWSVVIALLPAVFAAVYFFKARAISVVLTAVAGAVLTEYIFQKIRNKKIMIKDGSAVVTGLLLALTLPPSIPLWTAFFGSVVAIGLGKQVFGGIGQNSFNPALVGRAFLTASYPVLMTTWTVDGVSSATPLSQMKMEGIATDTWNLFVGQIGGSLGETSALALLLGFSYLLYKGYVNWRIPLAMVGTVFLGTFAFGSDPIFHLFAGGLMLGALFMATDMVSSPTTKLGRWIFGIGAGLLVVIIRLWGGYPEGVMYSILLMNTAVPLINRYTRPRSLGEVR